MYCTYQHGVKDEVMYVYNAGNVRHSHLYLVLTLSIFPQNDLRAPPGCKDVGK